jgi:hypothetical protein
MESQVRLYRTTEGIFVEEDGNFFAADATDRDRLNFQSLFAVTRPHYS